MCLAWGCGVWLGLFWCHFVANFCWVVLLSSNAKSLLPSFVKKALFSRGCEFSSVGRYFSLPKWSEDASYVAHGKNFFAVDPALPVQSHLSRTIAVGRALIWQNWACCQGKQTLLWFMQCFTGLSVWDHHWWQTENCLSPLVEKKRLLSKMDNRLYWTPTATKAGWVDHACMHACSVFGFACVL